MSVEFFLDTNVLIYSFDKKASTKRKVAQQLIQHALASHQGILSYQVIQEFMNVTTRKLRTQLPSHQAAEFLRDILAPLCSVYPSIALYEKALELQDRWKFGFYDPLIIAAALTADCKTLYSEDLQHEQRIESLTIMNPFAKNIAVHEQFAAYDVVMASA